MSGQGTSTAAAGEDLEDGGGIDHKTSVGSSDIPGTSFEHGLPQTSSHKSIFRVPAKLRQLNDNAYTPQSVSIGPLHWGKPELKGMEECKERYLEAFLGRTTTTTKEGLLGLVHSWEEEVRSCYVETITLASDEFVIMVLVDSGFIIESMLRYSYDYAEQGIFHYVRLDMMLVENQLPFFVLDRLYELAFPRPRPLGQPSLLEISATYIFEVSLIYKTPKLDFSSSEVKHFVDLMRIVHVPSDARRSPQRGGGDTKYVRVQTASKLQEAGMTFKGVPSQFVIEIIYRSKEVLLEIPTFVVGDCTESVLRNMIVLELFLYRSNSFIIDYVCFMDALIDSAKDVDILINNGIINNYVGETQSVANMFNGLTTHTWPEERHYYFFQLSQSLNSYCEAPWHRWKATLKGDYFSSPIKGASVVAATILLVLTFIQTACSVIALPKKDTIIMYRHIALPVALVVVAGIVIIVYSLFGLCCLGKLFNYKLLKFTDTIEVAEDQFGAPDIAPPLGR